jgi:hypothetical protein
VREHRRVELQLVSRSSAIRIGGWDQNPMRNMTFNNIVITDSNRGVGIFLRQRGGIENLCFSNMVIQTRLHTGDWWGNGEPIHISAARVEKDVSLGQLRHIRFDGITCESEAGIVLDGTPEGVLHDISFDHVQLKVKNSRLNDVAGGDFDLRPVAEPSQNLFAHDIPGIYAAWVDGLTLSHVQVSWDRGMPAFYTHALEAEHSEGVRLDDFEGVGAHPGVSAVKR